MVEPWLFEVAQKTLLSTLVFETMIVCFMWAYKEQMTLEMELLGSIVHSLWIGQLVVFTAMDLSSLILRHATGVQKLPSIIRIIAYYLGIPTK